MGVIKIVNKTCVYCQTDSTMEVDADSYVQWLVGGAPIQDVFPDMDDDDRETLVNGTHPQCFGALWPDLSDYDWYDNEN